MKVNLKECCEIAIEAAKAAGKIISEQYPKNIEVHTKDGGESYAAQVVTEVDKACEKTILKHLATVTQKYDLALLSEETEDDGSRFQKDYFWCIDPMDGTLAFIEKRSGFSVSIALVKKDGEPVVGVVYDPLHDVVYTAYKNGGVFKNGVPFKGSFKRNRFHLCYG